MLVLLQEMHRAASPCAALRLDRKVTPIKEIPSASGSRVKIKQPHIPMLGEYVRQPGQALTEAVAHEAMLEIAPTSIRL